MAMLVSDPAPIVTSMLALEEKPCIVAVMVVVPTFAAVATPEVPIVATAGLLDAHVTWFVTSVIVGA